MEGQELSTRFAKLLVEYREGKDECSTEFYSEIHYKIIKEYGRFPHRNRVST